MHELNALLCFFDQPMNKVITNGKGVNECVGECNEWS